MMNIKQLKLAITKQEAKITKLNQDLMKAQATLVALQTVRDHKGVPQAPKFTPLKPEKIT